MSEIASERITLPWVVEKPIGNQNALAMLLSI